MGNAAIWFAPETAAGTLRKISLPGRLSDLQPAVRRDVDIAQAWGGRFDEQAFRAQPRAEVRVGPFRNELLWREFARLENHLERGGSCLVAEDDAKAWAAFIDPPQDGQQIFVATSTPWELLGGAPSFGDTLMLEGPSPEHLMEPFGLLSWTEANGAVIVGTPAIHDWSSRRWALLRTRGFWPEMVRAKEERGSRMLTRTPQGAYTFSVTLDMDIDAINAHAAVEGLVLQGETEVAGAIPNRTVTGSYTDLSDSIGGGGPNQFFGGR